MEDFAIFIFGLLATIMAIGPLVIAMVADFRAKRKKKLKNNSSNEAA